MNTFVRCDSLFTGREDEAQPGGMLVFDPEGRLLYAGEEAGAPRRAKIEKENRRGNQKEDETKSTTEKEIRDNKY